MPTGSARAARRTDSGLGDLVLAATYTALDLRASKLQLDITGKVKFGTADAERGLGTGYNDYLVAADVYKTIKSWRVFGGVGYRWTGRPVDSVRRNIVFGTVGASYRMQSGSSIGMALDIAQASLPGPANPVEVSIDYGVWLGRNDKLRGYALAGLSSASPTFGVGIGLTHFFDR